MVDQANSFHPQQRRAAVRAVSRTSINSSATLPAQFTLAVVAVFFFFLAPLEGAAAQSASSFQRDTASYEVAKVVFSGNREIKTAELRGFVQTEATRCKSFIVFLGCLLRVKSFSIHREINPVEIQRDEVRIRAEYFRRGFRNTTAESRIDRRGNRAAVVTFIINEGEPTRIASFGVRVPSEILSETRVNQLVRIRPGQPLSLIVLDTARARLREALWQRGYSDAIVSLDTTSTPAGVDVVIDIDPRWLARVEEIQVSGNQKIGEQTIRNSMFLKVGKEYRLSDLERSQRALYESGLFRRAEINVVPGVGDSAKKIIVDVDEAKLRQARIGAGVSTVEFFQVEGSFTNFNWMGDARRVGMNLTLGNLFAPQLNGKAVFRNALEGIEASGSTYLSPTWRASAELRIPWFQSPRNEVALSAFAQRRSLPGIFVDRSIGFNGVFTREIADRVPVSFGYQYELTRVTAGDVYFCVNFGICDPPTIAALRSTQALSPFTISTTIDRRDDALSATRGFFVRGSLEHASTITLSSYRYNRAQFETAHYLPFLQSMVVALHGRFGWVSALGSTEDALGIDAEGRSILHPRKRFFAGGSQSVRGFGEAQLGPRILTIPDSVLIAAGCTVNEARVSCDEATLNDRVALPDTVFSARPLGGNILAEASVELRFPLMKALGGAVFVDAALVGESGLSALEQSTIAITPGFGFRYNSMAGPIRIDLGYNPFLTEDLPVVTNVDTQSGSRIADLEIVRTSDGSLAPARRTFTPPRPSGFLGFLSRFTLHLSIGQAF